MTITSTRASAVGRGCGHMPTAPLLPLRTRYSASTSRHQSAPTPSPAQTRRTALAERRAYRTRHVARRDLRQCDHVRSSRCRLARAAPGRASRALRRELRAVCRSAAGGFLEGAGAFGVFQRLRLQGAFLVKRGDAGVADEHVSKPKWTSSFET